MQFDEQSLFRKIKEQDRSALESLFKIYHPKLFSFAKRYIKDDEHAREIVLDVFLNFWKQAKTIEIRKSIAAYLFVSTKNQCLNFLRSQKKILYYYSEDELLVLEYELNSLYNNELIELLTSENIELEIKNAIDELPPQQKKIIILSRIEGFTSAEIANQLNIAPRTVETHIYLAIKYLKERLQVFSNNF